MWKCYGITYKAKSPLHIGYGAQLGIVNRTRYYVPGKTMWGAVTAVLSRSIMQSYDAGMYRMVKDFVKEHLIFSYFYPVTGASIFYPNYTKAGLGFGSNGKGQFVMSKEEFEKEFIISYVSTAIERGKGAAEEASLHELELISPTHITGYLFTDLDKDQRYADTNVNVIAVERDRITVEMKGKEIELFDAITDIQVGGERIYGFGALTLTEKSEVRQSDTLFGKNELVLTTNGARVTTDGAVIALSHVRMPDRMPLNSIKEIKGDMEPLVVREWDSKGAGRYVNYHGIALAPGTWFETDFQVAIDEFGLWKLSDSSSDQKAN